MVLVGGRDRRLAEFRELARAAGLDVHAAAGQPPAALSSSAPRDLSRKRGAVVTFLVSDHVEIPSPWHTTGLRSGARASTT